MSNAALPAIPEPSSVQPRSDEAGTNQPAGAAPCDWSEHLISARQSLDKAEAALRDRKYGPGTYYTSEAILHSNELYAWALDQWRGLTPPKKS